MDDDWWWTEYYPHFQEILNSEQCCFAQPLLPMRVWWECWTGNDKYDDDWWWTAVSRIISTFLSNAQIWVMLPCTTIDANENLMKICWTDFDNYDDDDDWLRCTAARKTLSTFSLWAMRLAQLYDASMLMRIWWECWTNNDNYDDDNDGGYQMTTMMIKNDRRNSRGTLCQN